MLKVGIIGWRGMVGSVLMGRMKEEDDFKFFEPFFFSTTQAGQKGPDIGKDTPLVDDASKPELLKKMDILVSCQGGDYTKQIYPVLRKDGWTGYWIDAASALRMGKNSIIVLDPVNRHVIKNGLNSGIKDYIGGNCTVSLMLMAIGELFKKEYIEWMTTMTYQAASGAGAKNMTELVKQMAVIGNASESLINDPSLSILDLDRKVSETIRDNNFPIDNFGAPLAGSLIPWIDSPLENGQTREEWKGYAETNKILQTVKPIPIDGLCVRIGAMRCHSQAVTIKLTKDIPIDEIKDIIKTSNEWVQVVENTKAETLKDLTPASVSGTLKVPVGRIRKLNVGNEYLTAFTVGDQLLWGAAEPIRRILRIVIEHLNK
ncbi:MAG: aspartate-semialdehyde dehydrogenase [Desulfobacterales bacterium]|nr:aspartate-semialdehyde dehydrogenase [Desulfobacterales bacterium]